MVSLKYASNVLNSANCYSNVEVSEIVSFLKPVVEIFVDNVQINKEVKKWVPQKKEQFYIQE